MPGPENPLFKRIDEEIRQSTFVVSDVAGGYIKWAKALGRPSSSQLKLGFLVGWEYHLHQVFTDYNALDKEITLDYWQPGSDPVVEDGVEEPDRYSVRYSFRPAPQFENRVRVRFTAVDWIGSSG